MTTSKRWTADARAKQAEIIHRWRPWGSSTGPKTAAGKATASQNACNRNPILAQVQKMLAELRAASGIAPRRRPETLNSKWENADE